MDERTVKEVIRIQMAPVIDSISDDGEHVGSRMPYPFFVDENGFVQQQDFWQGMVFKVIGFQNHPSVQKLSLLWSEVKDPSEIIGKYLVTTDVNGQWGSFPTAITQAEKTEAVL